MTTEAFDPLIDAASEIGARPACVLGCRSATGEPFPAQHGYLTCDPCSEQLRDALDEVVDLFQRLDPRIATGSAAPHTGRAPGFGSRSPARDSVLALTDPRTHAAEDGDPHSVREILASWAANVRDDIGLTDETAVGELAGLARREAHLLAGWLDHAARQPWAARFADHARHLHNEVSALLERTQRTVVGEARFLIHWWGHVTRCYWVADFADEVYELRHQLRVAAGTAEPTVPVGKCPTPVVDLDHASGQAADAATSPCGAPLRARLGADRITCNRCGTSWPSEHWDELRDDLGTPVSDVASLSVWLHKPAGTLRRWRHEDRWHNHGTKSRPLYARTDVLASWRRRASHAATA